MKNLFILFLILSGCASTIPNVYNHDREQDKECILKYGATTGYCDKGDM